MNKNKLILITGASGSGKSSISEILEQKYGLKNIPSYTTRPPRYENEKGHIFVNDKDFDEILQTFNVIGYTLYNGYRYCATQLQAEENSLYVIDPNGINFLKNKYDGNKEIVVVYIKSPDEVRKARMRARGDSEEKISERMENDERFLMYMEKLSDIVIENNNGTDINNIAEKIYREFIKQR